METSVCLNVYKDSKYTHTHTHTQLIQDRCALSSVVVVVVVIVVLLFPDQSVRMLSSGFGERYEHY